MIKFKKGFSLLVAVFVIMLLSLVATYIFYASSSIVKEGTLQYQEEEAKILARSYTEYAVMAISGNDRSSKCIEDIRANIGNPNVGAGFRIRVEITYIGNQKYIQKCRYKAATLNNSDTDTLMAIIDVYVEYKDIMHPSLIGRYSRYVPWQVYHKRSIQKI